MGKITFEDYKEVRRNKSFTLNGNRYEARVRASWLDNLEFHVPIGKTMMLIRGLLSYYQQFHRRKK